MTDTLSTPHQLPNEILRQWRPLLGAANLTEAQTALIWAAICYALPPISLRALSKSVELYICDHAFPISMETSAAIHTLPIPDSENTAIARSHPLFYAMTNAHRGGSLSTIEDPFQQAARRLLSSYFSTVDGEADAEILYADVQQCRDVLTVLANLNTSAPSADMQADRYMMEQINQNLIGRPGVSKDLSHKIRRFQQLYIGLNNIEAGDGKVRLPGIRKVSRRHGGGSGKTKKRRSDKGLTDELRHALTQIAQQPRSLMTDRHEEEIDQKQASQSAAWGTEIDSRSYHVSVSASATGETLDDTGVTVRRKTPSLLAPSDDRAVLRRTQRLAAVDSLQSMSDIQRLTATQVSETLTVCHGTPQAWALAILLLATGMPLKRLQELSVTNGDPAEPTDLDANVPCWHPERRLLWYQLLDGPSGECHGAHRTVVLSLPTALNHALKASVPDTGDHRPLYAAPRLLKRALKRAFSDTCGQRPSPLRLTASSWLLIRSLARDDVAAKALSGQFGVTHGAPAAYRQLEPGELNALFQSALACLIPASVPTYGPDETNVNAMPDAPGHEALTWQTGSDRAWPVSRFQAWFAGLYDAAMAAIQAFHRPLMPADRRPEDVLDILSYSAAYTYLTLLLTTGCRPHAQRVRCELLSKDLWVADKDSPTHRESRVVPAATQLRDALTGHQALLSAANQWLVRRGYRVEDSREPGQEILPGRYRVTAKRRPRVAVSPLDHSAFIELLANLPHDQDDPDFQFTDIVRNVTRHSVTSSLRQKLPEPQLSALLGHVGIGFRQSAPGSTAPLPQRDEFQTAITALLEQAGYVPLPYQEVIRALGQ